MQCKPAWYKSTAGNTDTYKHNLTNMLQSKFSPTSTLACTNLSCDDADHIVNLNAYPENLNDSCVCSIPSTERRSKDFNRIHRLYKISSTVPRQALVMAPNMD
jgi:hypothetical protein